MNTPTEQQAVGSSRTAEPSALATAAGGVVVSGVLIYWLGWTLLYIAMWIIVAVAFVVAAICGYLAIHAKDTDERTGAWMFCGGGVLLGVVVWLFIPSSLSETVASADNSRSSVKEAPPPPPPDFRQSLINHMHSDLNRHKQEVFNALHPTGMAKRVVVHDVSILWKAGSPQRASADIIEYTTRFTLYWSGPLTKDGFTKLSCTYDAESKRWTRNDVLATNGITNEKALELVGFGIGLWVGSMFSGD